MDPVPYLLLFGLRKVLGNGNLYNKEYAKLGILYQQILNYMIFLLKKVINNGIIERI